jgi:hypothetical protein
MKMEENNKYKQVYKSTSAIPFEVWFAPQDAVIKYPYTEVAPDPSIEAPIFIWEGQKWVENTEVSQAAMLNDLKQAISKIEDSNKNNLTSITENQAKMLKMLAPLLAKGGKPNA